MKALVKSQPGVSYTYEDVPVPNPVGDELLVKVGKVALCGSDISLYQWNEGERERIKFNYMYKVMQCGADIFLMLDKHWAWICRLLKPHPSCMPLVTRSIWGCSCDHN